MPNEYSNTPYKMAQQAQKSAVLPPSNGESVKPDFLLHHENHFDPNVHTPESLIEKGVLKGRLDPVKTA